MTNDEIQVSRNIKSARARIGYSQQETAKLLGITKETFINIENNPFSYTVNRLNEIAKILNSNLNEFFLPLNITNSEINAKQK